MNLETRSAPSEPPRQLILTPHVGVRYERGAIVEFAWGYEQTNIDFYVIVSRTDRGFVNLLPMESVATYDPARMTGTKMPGVIANAKPLRRKLKFRDGECIGLQIESYGWCSLWDGNPAAYSTYA